jgi:hypothetical protein
MGTTTTTVEAVENALNGGLQLIEKLAPLASLGGPTAASIGTIVAELATVASNILAQVESDASIIAGGNLAAIQALAQKLQAANAKLAAQIAAS